MNMVKYRDESLLRTALTKVPSCTDAYNILTRMDAMSRTMSLFAEILFLVFGMLRSLAALSLGGIINAFLVADLARFPCNPAIDLWSLGNFTTKSKTSWHLPYLVLRAVSISIRQTHFCVHD